MAADMTQPGSVILCVTPQQYAIILAGLRVLQAQIDLIKNAPTTGIREGFIRDILTNGDQYNVPTAEEIDELCRSIN